MIAVKKILKNTTETKVRFSEVDSMGVVWHGNYVKYIEDGREAFGAEFGLSYHTFMENKVAAPIVKLEMNYKKFLLYGERIRIETEYISTLAAKILFKYKIVRCSDNELILEAGSMQVFSDKSGELYITNPKFYEDWKAKWGVMD